MAVPVVASVGTFGYGTRNIPVPASVASGDIILLILTPFNTTETITALPSGFAEISNSPVSAPGQFTTHMYWKRASGADTGTYNFTTSPGSVFVSGMAIRLTGCAPSGNPIDVVNSAGAITITTTPNVSLTTTTTDELLVWWCQVNNARTIGLPTGFTSVANRTADNSNAVASLAKSTPGATGTVNTTISPSDSGTAFLVAVKSTAAAVNTGNFFRMF